MLATTQKECRRLRAGDIVLDCVGRPLFQVSEVLPAKMRGYVVVFGASLTADVRTQLPGHGQDLLTVMEAN